MTKAEIFEKVTVFEKTCLMKLMLEHICKIVTGVKSGHNKKLTQLWKHQRPRAADSIINSSSYNLSIEEKDALRYGLIHHVLPFKVHIDEIKTNIEKMTYTARKIPVDQ